MLGDMVIGVLVVCMVTLCPGADSDGDEGCVRSKPVCDEWSQKFDADPMRALRCESVEGAKDIAMELGCRLRSKKVVEWGIFLLRHEVGLREVALKVCLL